MIKRLCDQCGKEIDITNSYAVIEVSVRTSGGVLGPEHQFDLCYDCMSKLLKECDVDNENLGR